MTFILQLMLVWLPFTVRSLYLGGLVFPYFNHKTKFGWTASTNLQKGKRQGPEKVSGFF